jgi:TolB-like protein/Flp pilus assembly protein TadD
MAVADPVPLCFDGLTLDPAARTLVNAGGENISLRRSEFELLLAFVDNPGRVLSRDYLLEAVAGRHSDAFDRSIDVLVGRLRRKIEPEPGRPRLILTVPGIGYQFAVKPYPVALPAEEKNEAGPTTPLPTPRLSIVVLPFTNLSNDPEQQYFADGITEDLTIDLSRIEHMFVISRNTAFTYQNKRVDTKQIGRELGVRYVLEGSVRRSGNQVRVNAQLIDAETNAHLWAGRFDGKSLDLFDLQNEVTSRIAIALNLELIAADATRPTDHPDVLEYILRGRAVRLSPVTRANHREAIGWFERALVLDPRSVKAQSSLAVSLVGRVLDGMTDTPAADIQRAEELARKVIAVSPRDARAHFARGQVHRVMGRYDEAIREYEMALELNRNWMRVIGDLGWCKFLIGSIEEAISLHEQAIRQSPRDPGIGNWYNRLGRIHLLQSRNEEAIVLLEKARSANPEHPNVRVDLAAAYALKGETDRAATELAEARRLSPDGRYSSIARLKVTAHWGAPKISALFETTFFAGLRKAGMPEE